MGVIVLPLTEAALLLQGEIIKPLFRRAVLPGKSLGRGVTVTGWAALWGWSLQAGWVSHSRKHRVSLLGLT